MSYNEKLLPTSTENVRKPLGSRSLMGDHYALLISVWFYNRHISTGYSPSRLRIEIIVHFREYLHVTVHSIFLLGLKKHFCTSQIVKHEFIIKHYNPYTFIICKFNLSGLFIKKLDKFSAVISTNITEMFVVSEWLDSPLGFNKWVVFQSKPLANG